LADAVRAFQKRLYVSRPNYRKARTAGEPSRAETQRTVAEFKSGVLYHAIVIWRGKSGSWRSLTSPERFSWKFKPAPRQRAEHSSVVLHGIFQKIPSLSYKPKQTGYNRLKRFGKGFGETFSSKRFPQEPAPTKFHKLPPIG